CSSSSISLISLSYALPILPVEHGLVYVQLRVPVARRVLQEARYDPVAGGRPPAGTDPADLLAVVTHSGVRGDLPELVHGHRTGLLDRVGDLRGRRAGRTG